MIIFGMLLKNSKKLNKNHLLVSFVLLNSK